MKRLVIFLSIRATSLKIPFEEKIVIGDCHVEGCKKSLVGRIGEIPTSSQLEIFVGVFGFPNGREPQTEFRLFHRSCSNVLSLKIVFFL